MDLPSLPKSRLLVADDDPDMRHIVASTLRDDGYEVMEAVDGTDLARRLLCDDVGLIDLVVSDIYMPGMTGLEVLAAARTQGLSTTFIFMSAGSDSARDMARQSGAVAVFEKPFDLMELSNAARYALGSPRPQRPGGSPSQPTDAQETRDETPA